MRLLLLEEFLIKRVKRAVRRTEVKWCRGLGSRIRFQALALQFVTRFSDLKFFRRPDSESGRSV
jgi:hypothetical protein